MTQPSRREVPVVPAETALLFIDVQNYCAKRGVGYLDTLAPDACATYSQKRHDNTLRAIKGYCRQRTTEELLNEIGRR